MRVLLVAAVFASLALAGCTDKLSFSSASFEEPGFELSPAEGDADTEFRVSVKGLDAYNLTWDWGDGKFSYGAEASHVYGFTNGLMTVTLLVTDASGEQNFATRQVSLGSGENKPPTVTLRAGKSWVEVDEAVTLTATGRDRDGDPLAYHMTYAPAPMDGPVDVARQQPLSVVDGKANATFPEPGRYLVHVRALDPKGGAAEAQTFLNVSRVIPSSVFEATFEGTIKAGTFGNGVSEKAWGTPAPDTEIDAVRHPYALKYPGYTVLFLQWNDTAAAQTGMSAMDLDLELRSADTGEVLWKSENHPVNTSAPGAPTPLPPVEFATGLQEPGNYHVVVRGYAAADVPYTLLLRSSLMLTPERVAAVEGA